MAMRALASSRPRSVTTKLRFPCGHLDGQRNAEQRTRATATAVWVPCGKCNIIAVAVRRVARPRARRAPA
jgi:hypothetical protein